MVNPTPKAYLEPAHNMGCGIINHLWNNWGEDKCGLRDGEVDLYSVNIPLIEQILGVDGLKICWTTLWRNSYGRLFKNVSGSNDHHIVGPDSTSAPAAAGSLVFQWSPQLEGVISPSLDSLPVGSDGWALQQGLICVTPLRASFGEPWSQGVINEENMVWKVRL